MILKTHPLRPRTAQARTPQACVQKTPLTPLTHSGQIAQIRLPALLAWTLLMTLMASVTLSGCSVAGPRNSPINNVTKDTPTVLDIYRAGTAEGLTTAPPSAPRALMRAGARARPVAAGDDRAQHYWAAVDPMRQRFARLPNPDLVMVVFPHLSKGQYPVPGYVTVFPMYDKTEYALPGEIDEELWADSELLDRASPRSPRGGRP